MGVETLVLLCSRGWVLGRYNDGMETDWFLQSRQDGCVCALMSIRKSLNWDPEKQRIYPGDWYKTIFTIDVKNTNQCQCLLLFRSGAH